MEDIAARLEITRETARSHLTAVLAKTGAHSQLQAIVVARGAATSCSAPEAPAGP